MSIDEQLGRLIRLLNPYSTDMKHGADTPTPAGQPASSEAESQGQFPVQVDNYEGEWAFKGGEYKVAILCMTRTRISFAMLPSIF